MGRVPPDFSVSTHLQHEMVWGTEVYVGVGVEFLIKDTSGSQGPESGYCSISNLSLQPDSHPGLSCCQEERPKRGGKYTDSPKEAGQMPNVFANARKRALERLFVFALSED
ncbi:hypothetical protein NQZ68_023813 [Dissostichus eleginoides]|nr:hypothetical protein NQZ68_023813 [Dissostichus eleginoides]